MNPPRRGHRGTMWEDDINKVIKEGEKLMESNMSYREISKELKRKYKNQSFTSNLNVKGMTNEELENRLTMIVKDISELNSQHNKRFAEMLEEHLIVITPLRQREKEIKQELNKRRIK